jgi:N-acetylglucosaminyl-diphospho-decaprenol L-rhamnosyltransferase
MAAPGQGTPAVPAGAAVDVAIVNWNTPEAAAEAARGYLASTGIAVAVTVIDNASEPAARERLIELMPKGARLDLSEENLGFGAGANRALAGGGGGFVCVSNADVVPEPTALAQMAAVCAQPQAGMVGPAFGEQSAYHAELPSAPALALRPLVGGFRHRHVASPPPGKTIEVGQPAGACFLVRRQAWERLGGFDEDFFLWYEDVDLARRLREAGLRNYVTGDALVHHNEGLATRSLSPSRHQQARLDGLALYLRKHHPLTAKLTAPLLALARRLRVRGD